MESVIKLIGSIIKEYMDSIYYAMSRSCDRWNIRPTYGGFAGNNNTDDINEILKKEILDIKIDEKTYKIAIGDIFY